MSHVVRRVASFVDRHVARLGLRLEGPALLAFLFHAVFDGQDEIDAGIVHPQESLTVASLRRFLEHLLAAGYRFVDLAEVERGLDPKGRYACLTFDDGYANNARIGPVLREYRVPAAVFVSTRHVEEHKRFWWDAVYSERHARGASAESIEREILFLKSLPPDAIDAHLESAFGPKALVPRSDLDRPLTPAELRALGGDEWLTIGNHTMDHAILTVVPSDEARRQIVGAQTYLRSLLGAPARAIAYPNGNYDGQVLAIAEEAGLTCGITTIRRKERLPLSPSRQLEIGRFQLDARGDVDRELRVLRSGIQIANGARRLRRHRLAGR